MFIWNQQWRVSIHLFWRSLTSYFTLMIAYSALCPVYLFLRFSHHKINPSNNVQPQELTTPSPLSPVQVSNKGEVHIQNTPDLDWVIPVRCTAENGVSLSIFQGSPTNNVSPTSTPAKSSNAVPALQPPPGEGAAAAAAAAAATAAAAEPVEEWV